jgi:hypothetical protein
MHIAIFFIHSIFFKTPTIRPYLSAYCLPTGLLCYMPSFSFTLYFLNPDTMAHLSAYREPTYLSTVSPPICLLDAHLSVYLPTGLPICLLNFLLAFLLAAYSSA